MINLKKSKKAWNKLKLTNQTGDLREYKKHFQLAVINLEQNMIEERMPEFQQTA